MKLVLLALAALALSACASTSTSTSGERSAQPAYEEKVYRIGSNIPVRDKVSSSPSTTLDPSALGTGAPPRTN